MENLHFKIETDESAVVIRQGAAAPIYDPIPVILSGTITAPGDFFANRMADRMAAGKSDIDAYSMERMPGRCHVVANYATRTIKLRWNEANKFASEISGTLTLHPALASLTINSSKTYDEKGLLNLIKYNRAYFADRDQFELLRQALMKFNATVSQAFKNENDYKGAEAQQRLVNVSHGLQLTHRLAVPIFAGTEPSEFDIDICLGLNGEAIDFWIESVDLKEQIVILTESLFEDELKRFDGVVVVKQY